MPENIFDGISEENSNEAADSEELERVQSEDKFIQKTKDIQNLRQRDLIISHNLFESIKSQILEFMKQQY